MTPADWKHAALGAGVGFGVVLGLLIWRSCRTSTMSWADLIIDDATGKASITKVWTHLVNATALGVVVRVCWNAGPSDGVQWLLAVVLGLIGSSQAAMRAIATKFGGAVPTPGIETTSTETKTVSKTVTPITPPVTAAATESAAPPTGRSTP